MIEWHRRIRDRVDLTMREIHRITVWTFQRIHKNILKLCEWHYKTIFVRSFEATMSI